MQRVRIPDPMAHMWAIMRSNATPEWKLLVIDALCPSQHDSGKEDERAFLCTRPYRHTGRHAASDGDYIIAVWD